MEESCEVRALVRGETVLVVCFLWQAVTAFTVLDWSVFTACEKTVTHGWSRARVGQGRQQILARHESGRKPVLTSFPIQTTCF